MNAFITQHRPAIEELCRSHHVRQLEVFGSAATDRFDPATSDVDLIVSFTPWWNRYASPIPPAEYSDNYFHLHAAFESLFERHVDMIVDTAITNPNFLRNIATDRTILFPPPTSDLSS